MRQRQALKILRLSYDLFYPWSRVQVARRLQARRPMIGRRLREMARRRLRELRMEPIEVKWSWCSFCRAPMIHCPDCGNNTCNGGSECGLCYEIEALSLEARGGRHPTVEEISGHAYEEAEVAPVAPWGDVLA